jgi:hypothetical protein
MSAAAAVLGASQFVADGLASRLVGALHNGTAVPLALIIVTAAGLADVLLVLAASSSARSEPPVRVRLVGRTLRSCLGLGSTSGRGPYRIVSAIAAGFWR